MMMDEMVRIPGSRVKVLLGREGATKRRIEKKCKVSLTVDSEGDVDIEGEPEDVFFAKDVVKAIGRGFAPEVALKLMDQDYGLYIIPLKEVVGSEAAISRLKARVIGEKGRIKGQIEHATDSFLSIYGNTIGIISRADTMEYAKEAIAMLVDGVRHSTLLSFLSKSKRQIVEARLRGQ